MALSEAVLDVAAAMEDEVAGYTDAGEKYLLSMIKSFARQLRTAVKAADRPESAPVVVAAPTPAADDKLAFRPLIDSVKDEFNTPEFKERVQRSLCKWDEDTTNVKRAVRGGGVIMEDGMKLVEVVGVDGDPSFAPVASDAQPGSRWPVRNRNYILGDDGCLHPPQ